MRSRRKPADQVQRRKDTYPGHALFHCAHNNCYDSNERMNILQILQHLAHHYEEDKSDRAHYSSMCWCTLEGKGFVNHQAFRSHCRHTPGTREDQHVKERIVSDSLELIGQNKDESECGYLQYLLQYLLPEGFSKKDASCSDRVGPTSIRMKKFIEAMLHSSGDVFFPSYHTPRSGHSTPRPSDDQHQRHRSTSPEEQEEHEVPVVAEQVPMKPRNYNKKEIRQMMVAFRASRPQPHSPLPPILIKREVVELHESDEEMELTSDVEEVNPFEMRLIKAEHMDDVEYEVDVVGEEPEQAADGQGSTISEEPTGDDIPLLRIVKREPVDDMEVATEETNNPAAPVFADGQHSTSTTSEEITGYNIPLIRRIKREPVDEEEVDNQEPSHQDGQSSTLSEEPTGFNMPLVRFIKQEVVEQVEVENEVLQKPVSHFSNEHGSIISEPVPINVPSISASVQPESHQSLQRKVSLQDQIANILNMVREVPGTTNSPEDEQRTMTTSAIVTERQVDIINQLLSVEDLSTSSPVDGGIETTGEEEPTVSFGSGISLTRLIKKEPMEAVDDSYEDPQPMVKERIESQQLGEQPEQPITDSVESTTTDRAEPLHVTVHSASSEVVAENLTIVNTDVRLAILLEALTRLAKQAPEADHLQLAALLTAEYEIVDQPVSRPENGTAANEHVVTLRRQDPMEESQTSDEHQQSLTTTEDEDMDQSISRVPVIGTDTTSITTDHTHHRVIATSEQHGTGQFKSHIFPGGSDTTDSSPERAAHTSVCSDDEELLKIFKYRDSEETVILPAAPPTSAAEAMDHSISEVHAAGAVLFPARRIAKRAPRIVLNLKTNTQASVLGPTADVFDETEDDTDVLQPETKTRKIFIPEASDFGGDAVSDKDSDIDHRSRERRSCSKRLKSCSRSRSPRGPYPHSPWREYSPMELDEDLGTFGWRYAD